MFKSIARIILNFVLSGLLVLVFSGFGWIKIEEVPQYVGSQQLNSLVVAGIIALVIFLVGEIVGLLYRIAKKLLFFAGCVVTIVYVVVGGYIKLYIASLILGGWFTYTNELIPVIIISLLIGLIRIPHRDEVSSEMKQFRKWQKENKQHKSK